jgi:hypothetical protein
MEEFTGDNSEPTEQDESLVHDAVPLCPNCLEPCDPLSHYCSNCGSNEVVNPLASYMPFVNIRFQTGVVGKLWRKTWAMETGWIDRAIYIGLIILFYPIIFIVGMPYLIYEKIKRSKQKSKVSQGSE